jgi:Flp pilus assembly protein protease CpaA
MTLIIIKTLYVLLNVAIGIYDFSFYRIPNLLLGVLLVLYGLCAPFYMNFESIISALIVFAVVLVTGLILYSLKTIGGGDAKYLAVASLWAGFPGVVQLIFVVAIAGGIIAVIYLLLRDYVARLSDWMWGQIQKIETRSPAFKALWMGSGTGPELGKRDNIDSRMVPYGIAIALGSIILMLLHPLTL